MARNPKKIAVALVALGVAAGALFFFLGKKEPAPIGSRPNELSISQLGKFSEQEREFILSTCGSMRPEAQPAPKAVYIEEDCTNCAVISGEEDPEKSAAQQVGQRAYKSCLQSISRYVRQSFPKPEPQGSDYCTIREKVLLLARQEIVDRSKSTSFPPLEKHAKKTYDATTGRVEKYIAEMEQDRSCQRPQ